MANMDLVDEVMDFIHTNPEKHVQGTWLDHEAETDDVHDPLDPATNFCGTVGCIAGWTVALQKIKHDAPYEFKFSDDIEAVLYLDGTPRDMGRKAAEILGLTTYQADYIFDGNRELHEIDVAFEAIRDNPNFDPYAAPDDDEGDEDWEDD